MEGKNELFTEMLLMLRREYTRFLEIDKLTTELADVLSRDDRESAQLILDMRQDEMDEAMLIEKSIHTFLDALDTETRVELRSLVKGEMTAAADDLESGKIAELGEMIRRTLAHTVQIDQAVSRKLAGKDSFYAVKES